MTRPKQRKTPTTRAALGESSSASLHPLSTSIIRSSSSSSLRPFSNFRPPFAIWSRPSSFDAQTSEKVPPDVASDSAPPSPSDEKLERSEDDLGRMRSYIVAGRVEAAEVFFDSRRNDDRV